MGQWYKYSTIWEQNIVVVLHIYGDRAIFLLFCDYQDTKSEWHKIEMSISQPIFTHLKHIKGYMGYQYPYHTRWKKHIVVIFHIYEDRAIFYYFVISKALKMSHNNCKLVHLDQYKHFLNIQCSFGPKYPYPNIWEEMWGINSYL